MTFAGADVNTVNEAVSLRIKQFRKQRKISLDELSRKASVSKGMLVEIEGCKANPSIALLCRLAAAMGVSVADFVDVSAGLKCTSSLIRTSPNSGQETKGKRRLLAGSGGPDMLELWLWEMRPAKV